jgi:hypothetical protein
MRHLVREDDSVRAWASANFSNFSGLYYVAGMPRYCILSRAALVTTASLLASRSVCGGRNGACEQVAAKMHRNCHLPLVESVHRTDGGLGWRWAASAVVQSDNALPPKRHRQPGALVAYLNFGEGVRRVRSGL